MCAVHIFGDEAGNLDFTGKAGASEYFVVTTVTMGAGCAIGNELLDLRRNLPFDGHLLVDGFHCAKEKQAVRDAVFDLIRDHEIRVDATILHKRKAIPRLAQDPSRFVKQAWFLHFKYIVPRVAKADQRLLVAQAAVKTKRGREDLRSALDDVIDQVAAGLNWEAVFWPSRTDPCFWVADYCCWAIQRYYEQGDDRSYLLIADKVKTTFEPFKSSPTTYY